MHGLLPVLITALVCSGQITIAEADALNNAMMNQRVPHNWRDCVTQIEQSLGRELNLGGDD